MTTPTPLTNERLNLILNSLFYAEKMTGGIISGGASLDELITWQRIADIKDNIPHQPITENEMRELERRNLAHESHGIWRGILGRLGDSPSPFGLATATPTDP